MITQHTTPLSVHRWGSNGICADCGASRCVGILGDPANGDTARCHLAAAGQFGKLCVVHGGMERRRRRIHPGHWESDNAVQTPHP